MSSHFSHSSSQYFSLLSAYFLFSLMCPIDILNSLCQRQIIVFLSQIFLIHPFQLTVLLPSFHSSFFSTFKCSPLPHPPYLNTLSSARPPSPLLGTGAFISHLVSASCFFPHLHPQACLPTGAKVKIPKAISDHGPFSLRKLQQLL